MLLCIFTLKETLPKEKRQILSFSKSIGITYNVLLNKTFLYYALIPFFAYSAYFAYIVESPFILFKLGLPSLYIGYTYVFLSITYVIGNISAKKILHSLSIEDTINKGYIIFVIGGMLLALQIYISPFPLISTILSISILTFGNGFLLPLGTACAISAHSQASGAASGVMGAFQLGGAALSSFFIGKISAHSPDTVSIIIASICVIGFTFYKLGKIYKLDKGESND